MSSTNRSLARETHRSDYYVTPVSSITDFLNAFAADVRSLFPGQEYRDSALAVLDPCAGGDTQHPMSYPVALRQCAFFKCDRIDTVDIREDSLAETKADYLAMPKTREHDLIITNPPFNIALPIIQKALAEVGENGLVVMLLRLNFFGSKERKAWFQANMPVATYVHSRRMKFSNTSGTDSIEYMHAVWQKGAHPRFTQLRII